MSGPFYVVWRSCDSCGGDPLLVGPFTTSEEARHAPAPIGYGGTCSKSDVVTVTPPVKR